MNSHTKSLIARGLVYLGATITFGALFFMLLFVFINGVPYISLDLFAWEYTTENVSLMPALITTLFTIGGSLLVAGPIGIFTAIYLVEYADRTKPVVKLIGMATDTLAAVPSIVYGLFGFLFFCNLLRIFFLITCWNFHHDDYGLAINHPIDRGSVTICRHAFTSSKFRTRCREVTYDF